MSINYKEQNNGQRTQKYKGNEEESCIVAKRKEGCKESQESSKGPLTLTVPVPVT
jgi:hypothetical protein